MIVAVDALVLTGGPDLDPTTHQGPPATRSGTDLNRDTWETALLHAALRRQLPVLAVCRGLQVLNVAFGGSLREVPGHAGAEVRHRVEAIESSDGSAWRRVTPPPDCSRESLHHLKGLDRSASSTSSSET